MKNLFLSGLGAALILSSGLAYGNYISLKANLVGENTNEAVSLQATAKAFDTAVLAGNLAEAKTQLICLNALVGDKAGVVVKTDLQVIKGWVKSTTTKTEYAVTGRNSLVEETPNNVDVDMVLSSLGFAKYADIQKTNLTGKVAYLQSYLSVMDALCADKTLSMSVIQDFHNRFKTNFAQLSAVNNTKSGKDLAFEAHAAALEGVTTEVTKSWLEGKKAKISFGAVLVLMAMAVGERTI